MVTHGIVRNDMVDSFLSERERERGTGGGNPWRRKHPHAAVLKDGWHGSTFRQIDQDSKKTAYVGDLVATFFIGGCVSDLRLAGAPPPVIVWNASSSRHQHGRHFVILHISIPIAKRYNYSAGRSFTKLACTRTYSTSIPCILGC